MASPLGHAVKTLPFKEPQLANEDQTVVPLHTAWGQSAKSATGEGGRKLTLYSVFLHFLDLGDGLSQVVGELLAVLGVGRVEVDEDFDVGTWDG